MMPPAGQGMEVRAASGGYISRFYWMMPLYFSKSLLFNLVLGLLRDLFILSVG
jgi:hypothetical protein